MENPYQPPRASIAADPQTDLSRLSVWLMIGLTIITLGLYLPYWIYTRTKAFNRLTNAAGPNQAFTTFTAAFFVVTYGVDIGREFIDISHNMEGMLSALSLASNICVMVWALMFRSGLNRYTKVTKRDPLWSNAFLAWFFQAFYHQYKINQILSTQNAESLEPAVAVDPSLG